MNSAESTAVHNEVASPSRYPYDYVMIVSQGRSGTNWLLQLLDLSLYTHCRNEPNEIIGSPLAELPDPWIRHEQFPALEAGWDRAIASTVTRFGERDQPIVNSKLHIHELSSHFHLHRCVERRRLRSAISLVFPAFRHGEWELPWWLGRTPALRQALPVLKMLQVPGWTAWVLANRPRALVVHIVRHPGGFLHSWRNRYVHGRAADAIAAANRVRLHMVVVAKPHWADCFGDIDRMPADESELWYWRYASETIHRAGVQSSAYELVLYDELPRTVEATVERLYHKCGLPWSGVVSGQARSSAQQSESISNKWRTELSPDDEKLLSRCLGGSLLRDWWN